MMPGVRPKALQRIENEGGVCGASPPGKNTDVSTYRVREASSAQFSIGAGKHAFNGVDKQNLSGGGQRLAALQLAAK